MGQAKAQSLRSNSLSLALKTAQFANEEQSDLSAACGHEISAKFAEEKDTCGSMWPWQSEESIAAERDFPCEVLWIADFRIGRN